MILFFSGFQDFGDDHPKTSRVTELPASRWRPVAGGGQQRWRLTGKSPTAASWRVHILILTNLWTGLEPFIIMLTDTKYAASLVQSVSVPPPALVVSMVQTSMYHTPFTSSVASPDVSEPPSHRVTSESTGKSPETGRRRRLTTVVSYQKITGGCGDAATMRRRLPSSGRTVAGYDERPADMVARESHARDFGRRVRPRRGGYPAEIPAPDSFQCHEHTGGVEIARNQTVREISTIF
ncbi:hypothetical protein F2Q70_00011261 [Brassica cretica]|uniref:Uncharacterized protein n=1 Tax=Brassica cretica TaxID=69181 RepID=A0A8S9M6G3_BRACR|nr:hypothetical protein F2Q70_00011261 [Brassica cretica]